MGAARVTHRLAVDDWRLDGQPCTLLDPEPVPGSTQCLIELCDGERVTLCRRCLVPGVSTSTHTESIRHVPH